MTVRSSRAAAAATALLLALVLAATTAGASAPRADASPAAARHKIDAAIDRAPGAVSSVIVQAAAGALERAKALVAASGGTVVADLPLVNGFEASVPGAALDALGQDAGVRSVSANASAMFEEFSYDDTTTASSFAKTSGATAGWAKGHLGQGVGVAVLDTGVSSQSDFAGRLVHGPDLSGEGTTVDSYGHGTVMAGIIGGSGADSASRTGGAYTGVAPKATVVAVKTAGRNGAVDVSTMLQAMHWVAAYRDQFNIRVMNLSWGTKSTQHPSLDPLNYGVQRLWQLGIVVVVAAGNSGPQNGTVTKPGDDPVVLTVGAFDDKGNVDPSDDSLSSWSSRGPTAAGVQKPDILAPGRSLVTTRSFGSKVEVENPKALVAPSYVKGSGTSQAAAVVSGLVAQMIGANPSLTPDQVKALLRTTATPLPAVAAGAQGAGRVGLGAALAANIPITANQALTATGLGSIEASRGGMNVQTDCNRDGVADVIKGEIDIRCQPWDPAPWTGNAWTGNAWTGNAWTGNAWTGNAWTGNAWTNATWTGNAWTGGTWTGNAWTGNAWTGNAWTGNAWTGNAWTDSKWTTSAWTTAGYGEWTTAEYDEFLTAFWGPEPPARFAALGERPDTPAQIAAAAPGGPPSELPARKPGGGPDQAPAKPPAGPDQSAGGGPPTDDFADQTPVPGPTPTSEVTQPVETTGGDAADTAPVRGPSERAAPPGVQRSSTTAR